MRYEDHFHAGGVIGKLLQGKGYKDPVVVGIPSGGVIVALRVALALKAPLRILVVHKIGMLGNPEVAIGAVTSEGDVLLNESTVQDLGYSEQVIERLAEPVKAEVDKRIHSYGVKAFQQKDLEGKTVILVDDGLATGFTMLAAVRTMKRFHPKEVIIAVPTAHREAAEMFQERGFDFLCPDISGTPFFAVSRAYIHWHNWDTQEVVQILRDEGGLAA